MFLLRRILILPLMAMLCATHATHMPGDRFVLQTDKYTFISQHSFTDADSRFGKMYCVPVAVANTFSMMQRNHTPSLTQARLLASAGFMQTDATHGTLIKNALYGIAQYTQQHIEENFELKYQGLSTEAVDYLEGPKPELSFIREHLGGRKALWAQIGFYQYNPYRGTYRRQGGHFVSVLGYENNTPNRFKMIIHDPMQNYQKTQHSILSLRALQKDERFIDYKGWERGRSIGFWEVTNFNAAPYGTIPIIDGIIGLKLATPQKIAFRSSPHSSVLP